ncbi:MAG TPA: glycosyltransferase [Coriobacteriia bacterium]|nr:glycosyltransferase [Coriobacteriia bacterium]
MKQLEDYRGIVTDEVLADLHQRAAMMFDRRVAHINSTAYGGGVAEILGSLVPLMNDAGVEAEWRVLIGSNDFFGVTKKFHNGLQGDEIRLTHEKKSLYLDANESFSQYTHIKSVDAVAVHDPQPLPLIRYYRKRQPWVWRCHIDLSNPNPELWEYLKGFVLRYDLVIVSHESYLRPDLPVKQIVVHPAIDPLTQKNVDLAPEKIDEFLGQAGVPRDKPLVTQISRFDRWKDPVGVIEAFKLVRQTCDCRLVLAGNAAMDDPEGAAVLTEARNAAGSLIDDGEVIFLLGANDVTINALQRASAVIVQKSLREGFGLTISEALWKGTPVVASAVGGIPLQLTHGEDGYLVSPTDFEEVARAVTHLLKDEDLRQELGQSGREHVRRDFLITRLLGHWLALLKEVIERPRC